MPTPGTDKTQKAQIKWINPLVKHWFYVKSDSILICPIFQCNDIKSNLSWLYLGVFEASHKYDLLPQLCCEWVQLHCDQSASRGQQTQKTDRSVATVHAKLQHQGGTDSSHHFIQSLSCERQQEQVLLIFTVAETGSLIVFNHWCCSASDEWMHILHPIMTSHSTS